MEERLILVTNDDGYDSRGMEAAVEVARTFGRVVVVAPETTQSGMSQAITMYSPLYLRSVREEEGLAVYAFSGTPVDCVKMAFDCLLRDERVDLVLSGINHGSNSAVNVLYSGTMGAAIEGSFYGCPAVGLSLDDHAADADFEAAVLYGRRIVGAVLDHGAELPLCLNAETVAKMLGVASSTVYELMHEADFPTLKIGNRMVVPKEQFIAWVQHHTEGAVR